MKPQPPMEPVVGDVWVDPITGYVYVWQEETPSRMAGWRQQARLPSVPPPGPAIGTKIHEDLENMLALDQTAEDDLLAAEAVKVDGRENKCKICGEQGDHNGVAHDHAMAAMAAEERRQKSEYWGKLKDEFGGRMAGKTRAAEVWAETFLEGADQAAELAGPEGT